jgi:predicted 3-demethylubiquinone-9 3-methyltransferase (glyoxalase superfamily)
MKFQKITPYFWFDSGANKAAEFYCSIFDNSEITSDGGAVIEFILDGTNFIALNGGPQYKFNEAISFYVLCNDQEEIDRLWNQLTSDGGSEGRCSWCNDKFGVSWQIVPKRFIEMMRKGLPDQKQRVMGAMMGMNKMIITELEKAFENGNTI